MAYTIWRTDVSATNEERTGVVELAADLVERPHIFVDGEWLAAHGGQIDVVNPTDQSVVGFAALGDESDMDAAVRAARTSFDDGRWAGLSGKERAEVMRRAADNMQARFDDISTTLTAELGCPLWFSRLAHVPNPIKHTRYFADLAEHYERDEVLSDENGFRSLVTQEAVGVVGAITPWNGPLSSPSLKVMPALAAGCSVVLKPPSQTPLSAFVMADAFAAAGLPAGVLNIVPAHRNAGQALVDHPEVDKLAFTGSTEVGMGIMHSAANRIARVTLELGGKSAAIVLEDADPETVVRALLPMSLNVNGQLCIAQTRILVPRSLEKAFVEALGAAMAAEKVGDPMAPDTKIGPLVSKAQRDRVAGYISLGRSEGARVVTGGEKITMPSELANGWFLPPTLLAGATNAMRVVREEIFGPVMAVVAYDDLDEAVRIANDSPYGLSGSVWGADVDRAVAVARRVRTGMLSINGAPQAYGAPFGGYKQSGIGREMGEYGYRTYLETKSIALGKA